MTAPPSEMLIPAAAVFRYADGGRELFRVDRRHRPPSGAELAVEDPMAEGGWRFYQVTASEFWYAATATHQPVPNMMLGDVTVEVRDLPSPAQPWVRPEPGVTGFVLQLDGREVGYVLPEGCPPIDAVSTMDDQAKRVRARVTGIRCWYGDLSVLPTGTPVYRHLVTAVQMTRIAL